MTGSDPSKHSPFHPGLEMSRLREVAFIVVISMAQLLTQASLGQVVVPIEVIGKSLGTTNPGQQSWTVAAFSLTVGTFVLPAGRLGDIYGHKRVLLGAYAWFALWSAVAGFSAFSRSLIFFAVCRALQGIAPAAILVNSVALLGRTYAPGPRKNYAFAIFAASAPNGFLVGALFASIFAEFVWWPWAFWVQAMVLALMVPVVYFVIPPDSVGAGESGDEDDGAAPPSRKFDYAGTVLGVSGLVLVNVAWNQAPVVGWPTPYTYILLIIGILLIGAFLFVETRVTAALVPVDVWNRHMGLMLGCIVLGWATFGIWNLYGTLFFLNIRHKALLLVTAQFVPAGIAGIAATMLTGFLLPRVGPSLVMAGAMLSFCVAVVLYAFVPVNQTFWAMTFVSMVIAPFGMDMSFPAASLVASNSVPRHQQGIAASLVNTFVNYSISLGLGIAGTVETHVNRGGQTPADTLRGYRAAFYLGIGFSGLGILLALANLLVARAEARRGPQGAAEKQSPPPRASEDGSQERTRLEHADAQGTSAGRDGPAEKKAQGAQAAA